MHEPYQMILSRMVLDKLGINLYDKASAVTTELVSNAYNADAAEVTIEIPRGHPHSWKKGKRIESSGYTIIVRDNCHGMVPRDIIPWYLTVGYNRRADKKRAKSPRFKRPVTGRKGIGKFAPFVSHSLMAPLSMSTARMMRNPAFRSQGIFLHIH